MVEQGRRALELVEPLLILLPPALLLVDDQPASRDDLDRAARGKAAFVSLVAGCRSFDEAHDLVDIPHGLVEELERQAGEGGRVAACALEDGGRVLERGDEGLHAVTMR